MKILAVSFKNINSLKGEHSIDFTAEEFLQNPLFAITGPTGSGKTTLLDVISLALFGEVPRLGKISNRIIEEKGAILTRNQEAAFAQVIYHCKQGRFASVWQISTARTGNLRDYEMELTKLNPVQRLDLKKSEIPSKNEELIGLSYSQFIKSVVLAQGEFSKFLKAPKKERSELLEKITGTGIYRELGIRAYREFTDRNKAIEGEEQLFEVLREKILPEREKHKKVEARSILKKNIEDLTKKREVVKEQIGWRKDLQELEVDIKKSEKELASQETKKREFEAEFGEKIKSHESVEEFSMAIRDWEHRGKLLDELKADRESLMQRKRDLEEGKNRHLQKTREFIQNTVEEEELMPALEAFYTQVNALQEKVKELGEHYKEERRAFNREVEGLELERDSSFFVKHPDRWKAVLYRYEKAEKEWIDYFNGMVPEDLEGRIDAHKAGLQLIHNARREQQLINEQREAVETLQERLKIVDADLKKIPGVLKGLEHCVKLGEKEVENLELRYQNQLMRVQVKDLRARLETGKPCIVCGSLEHPYAAHAPKQEEGLPDQIKKAKAELRQNSRELARKQTHANHLRRQEKEGGESLDRETTKLVKREAAFKKEYAEIADLEEQNWKEKMEDAEQKLEELHRFQKMRQEQEQIHRARPIFDQLLSFYKQGKKVKEEIQHYYRGDNLLKDYQQLQSNWQRSNQELDSIALRIKEQNGKLKTGAEAFNAILKTLLPKLQSKGFSRIQEAQKVLLPSAIYKKYRETRDEFERHIAGLISRVQTDRDRRNALQERLSTKAPREVLEQRLREIEKKIENETEEQKEIERHLKNDEELLQHIKELQKKIAERQEENLRWKLLSQLIGDSKGDRFNQFAQDLTMRHLLRLANTRLKDINGRYRLRIKMNTGKNEDNLVVSDLDMGGQERAVQTLSGGETFLMSLALALALSDLASKNVEINSLFIDEGFGTLDPETLDQTLDTLERLQASSRKTIGIISHVSSLKERIATQIQLEKNGQGYSSLKIVTL